MGRIKRLCHKGSDADALFYPQILRVNFRVSRSLVRAEQYAFSKAVNYRLAKQSNKNKSVVDKTVELYDSLPKDKESRMACIGIRDEIIRLNLKFFGYIANTTLVENSLYEDRFQTAVMAFLGMWWKYRWGRWAPENRKGDLSFGTFFKPRLSEEVRRYLSPVSYSTKRNLCIKAAEQLGKHWAEVRYEDLGLITLPPEDMNSLKAVLGVPYPADIDDYELFLESPEYSPPLESFVTDKYDTVEELLIQEMIKEESQLSGEQLLALSDLYTIDYQEIKAAYERALVMLYERLKS